MFEDYINSFGALRYRNEFEPSGDVEATDDYTVYGEIHDGAATGFVWISEALHFSGASLPSVLWMCGIVTGTKKYNEHLEEDVQTLECGISYRIYDPDNYYNEPPREVRFSKVSEPPQEVDVEWDGRRVLFIGMVKNGVRSGPGSEFTYDDNGQPKRRDGLWQDGVLTHIRRYDKLVPVGAETLEQED